MDIRGKVFLTLVFAVILVFALYFIAGTVTRTTGYVINSDNLQGCFAEKNIISYGSASCPECLKQSDLLKKFEGSFKYNDCDRDVNSCSQLTMVPAILVDGKMIYGLKSIEEIIEFARC